MHIAYIALGSNMGSRLENIKEALERLNALDPVTVTKCSGIYETAPVGGPVQGPYLNACALLETTLPATKLLNTMLLIEKEMGRVRTERWGPRTIDLDLLIYENLIMKTPLLELPHPRMTERAFVLVPLADIAPDVIVPGKGETVRHYLSSMKLSDDDLCRII